LNDSSWRFASVTQKPFGDLYDLDEARDWLPALVPGDVRLDLLRAGKIADPFYAANNQDSQWIDSRDWWYIRPVKQEWNAGDRAFLVFEGIDYQSAVFFAGKQLGRHVGMFSRQIYELPLERMSHETADAERSALLAVRIWGSDALPKLRLTLAQKLWGRLVQPMFAPPNEPFPDRYATLKCQMQFGWDFAPRLRTCGIWDDAAIVVARSVFIQDASVRVRVDDGKQPGAHIRVSLALDSDRAKTVRVQCAVQGKNFSNDAQTFSFDLALAQGLQQREIAFDLPNPQFWNPWDRGDPNLYEIEITLSSPSRPGLTLRDPELAEGESQRQAKDILDSYSTTFGIRSFELAPVPPDAPNTKPNSSPNSEPWTFVVNGQREFLRGANWVPLDAIPGRLTRADYASRLKQVRDANINFLRVWGGGLREKSAFYDLCDELGILVWQEFPFAGATLDRFPRDHASLDLVRGECAAVVSALRNHPALVVWCGGNEFNTRGNRTIVETLREVVAREDGTRPFKPASPYREESHNWGVWHGLANLRDYRKDQTPFLSEFGLQSLPDLESLNKFLPQQVLAAPHALWEYHHAELKKLRRYAGPVITNGAPGGIGRTSSAQSLKNSMESPSSQSIASALTMSTSALVDATQRAQAFGLQIAIEHMRRGKPRTSGVAVWQFDDAWPAISWSVVDYYGTPKRAYAELKRLYSPILASFDYALQPRREGEIVKGDLWLINDWLSSFQNAELSASLDGVEILKRHVNLAPDSATRVDALGVTLGPGENILRLKVTWGPATLSDHEYDLNFWDRGEVNAIGALLVAVGKRLMR
jgi:beta-mannosidase